MATYNDPWNIYGEDTTPVAPAEKRSLIDDLNHVLGGINQTRILTEQDRELNELKWKYMYDPNLTEDQQDALAAEYYRKNAEMQQTAQRLKEHQDYLDTGDSYASQIGRHALSAGSSLESMQGQYGANLAGAALGALIAGIPTGGAGAAAGAAAGWKLANIPSAIRANYRDAEAGAYDTWNDVLDKTGDPELAKQAFYESLKPNLGYAALATIPDIAIGGSVGKGLVGTAEKMFGKGSQAVNKASRIAKMMEKAQASKLGQGMERIANKIPDIEIGEGVGAWVAGKTRNPFLGKVARAGANVLAEDISEIGQEIQQGLSTNAEVARALHQYNPEQYKDEGGYSLGRTADWLRSEEGKKTVLDTLVATTLTGGMAAGVGGLNRLRAGYNNKTVLENAPEIVSKLSNVDPETLSSMKNVIGSRYGLDEQQTANLTNEQVALMWAEDYADRKQLGDISSEDAAVQGLNDYINKATGFVGREDYMSEDSERIFSDLGITNTQNLVDRETRLREEQEKIENKPTEAKESHDNTFSEDTKSFSQKVAETGTTNTNEQVQAEQAQTQSASGLAGILQQREQDFGGHWHVQQNATIGDNEYADNTVILTNDLTNKTIRVTDIGNGRLSVVDETAEGVKAQNGTAVQSGAGAQGLLNQAGRKTQFSTDTKGLKALSSFLKANEQETKTLKQEGEEAEQQQPADPNRRRAMVYNANDLANFYRRNRDLMNEDTFMGIARAMMTYGNKGVGIDLDLERTERGDGGGRVYGEYTVKEGTKNAVISLYNGADAMTVIHEFAHVGYDTMSEHEKQLFNQMAVATEETFVANVLRKTNPQLEDMSDEDILKLIRNSIQTKDGRVWRQINSLGILRQTIDIINGNASDEQIQQACEERYAWEFSAWYAEGYTKGMQPTNRMQNLLNRTCHTLQDPLALISAVAEHLQSPNWQAISTKSATTMYEDMNTRAYDTGNQNVRRVYGDYNTSTGQVQEEVATQEQVAPEVAQPVAQQEVAEQRDGLQQNLFSPEFMYPEQTGQPTYVQGELFQNNSGNTPNVVTTRQNEQRRQNAAIQQNERMQPVYLARLNTLVNKGKSVTQDEVQMVMSLSDKNYRQYANKVLAKPYPNAERLELLFYVDQQHGNNFADRIQKKMQVLQKRETRNAERKLERKNTGEINNVFEQAKQNRSSNNSAIGSVENTIDSLDRNIEGHINRIVNKLVELDAKGEKSVQAYINRNKQDFETDDIYKQALRKFNKNREKYRNIRQAESERYSEYEKQKENEKLQEYLSENEEGIQDKYNKLMSKYEQGGLDAVKNTMGSPAIRKDPRLWNEAYRRLEQDVAEQEQKKKEEKAKAFEQDVQKVYNLLLEKEKKGANSLRAFLNFNKKKFQEDDVYAEAKKRFDERKQNVKETPAPAQKETSQEVQKQQAAEFHDVFRKVQK